MILHLEEFEEYWKNMLIKYGLEENEWVLQEYEKRKSWAGAYLRDKFCAGFRTTSRCEGINNYIKRFVDHRQSLLELVQGLEHAVRDYRHNELVSQFNSVYGETVLTTGLDALELCAANYYTREILTKVKKEIQGVVALDIVDEENISTIVVLKVKECERRQRVYRVVYERNTQNMECQCSRWSSEGYPCSHMFCAMKRVGLQKLPESLLLKRWSKDAKKYIAESLAGSTEQDKERAFLMCYSALAVATAWMIFLGAQDGPSFHATMNEVCHLTNSLEQKSGLKKQTTKSPAPNLVGDPLVVKTKGAPKGRKEKGKRKCTECNDVGHSKKNCPAKNDRNRQSEGDSSGLQVNFDAEKANTEDPMDTQENIAMPSAKVDASFAQEAIDLSNSRLNNNDKASKPPFGSHQWLLQVMQQGQYPSFNGMHQN